MTQRRQTDGEKENVRLRMKDDLMQSKNEKDNISNQDDGFNEAVDRCEPLLFLEEALEQALVRNSPTMVMENVSSIPWHHKCHCCTNAITTAEEVATPFGWYPKKV